MNVRLIATPHLGSNDTEAKLVHWLERDGAPVSKGSAVCELETTKATIEVEAPADGYLHPLVATGSQVAVGVPLALLAEKDGFDIAAWQAAQDAAAKDEKAEPTQKARLLMQRHGVSIDELPQVKGRRLGEADVEAFLAARNAQQTRLGLAHVPRLAVLGGVSGGGAMIVIEAARRMSGLLPVAIYDRNPSFAGKSVLGVPVLGSMEDRMEQDRADGLFDLVIIAFNRNLAERDRLFAVLTAEGYQFANVIDPSADLRTGVSLGQGNVILGHSYVGACSRIGSNNFISAHVALEHGNILGDSCAFGPGVFTSGNVTIGDRVRFGTGIHIEPGLEIGSDAVIGSGQTLVTSVEAGKLLGSRAKG